MDVNDRFRVARTVLAELPCPVVVIGAAADGERSAATGTAMYVSFAPPAFAVAVHPGSTTCRLIDASGEFSISLLSDSDAEAAAGAGRSGAGRDKLDAIGLGTTESARSTAPALVAVPMTAWCRVTSRQEVGDHILFIGEVVDSHMADGGASPLLRHRRRYARRGEWLTEEQSGGYPT